MFLQFLCGRCFFVFVKDLQSVKRKAVNGAPSLPPKTLQLKLMTRLLDSLANTSANFHNANAACPTRPLTRPGKTRAEVDLSYTCWKLSTNQKWASWPIQQNGLYREGGGPERSVSDRGWKEELQRRTVGGKCCFFWRWERVNHFRYQIKNVNLNMSMMSPL